MSSRLGLMSVHASSMDVLMYLIRINIVFIGFALPQMRTYKDCVSDLRKQSDLKHAIQTIITELNSFASDLISSEPDKRKAKELSTELRPFKFNVSSGYVIDEDCVPINELLSELTSFVESLLKPLTQLWDSLIPLYLNGSKYNNIFLHVKNVLDQSNYFDFPEIHMLTLSKLISKSIYMHYINEIEFHIRRFKVFCAFVLNHCKSMYHLSTENWFFVIANETHIDYIDVPSYIMSMTSASLIDFDHTFGTESIFEDEELNGRCIDPISFVNYKFNDDDDEEYVPVRRTRTSKRATKVERLRDIIYENKLPYFIDNNNSDTDDE